VKFFTDCNDIDESCDFWNDQGYCNETDTYPFLLEVCALTCGGCEPCPTEEPKIPACDKGRLQLLSLLKLMKSRYNIK